jgi:hypothetical protein
MNSNALERRVYDDTLILSDHSYGGASNTERQTFLKDQANDLIQMSFELKSLLLSSSLVQSAANSDIFRCALKNSSFKKLYIYSHCQSIQVDDNLLRHPFVLIRDILEMPNLGFLHLEYVPGLQDRFKEFCECLSISNIRGLRINATHYNLRTNDILWDHLPKEIETLIVCKENIATLSGINNKTLFSKVLEIPSLKKLCLGSVDVLAPVLVTKNSTLLDIINEGGTSIFSSLSDWKLDQMVVKKCLEENRQAPEQAFQRALCTLFCLQDSILPQDIIKVIALIAKDDVIADRFL